MKPEAGKPSVEPLSERVRKRLLKHLGTKPCPTCGHSPRGNTKRVEEIAREMGLVPLTLQRFAKGGRTRSDYLDLISAWLDEQANGKSS